MFLSIVLLGAMALIGFVLSSISLREVKITRTFDDSLRSYYAAESGIEQSLDLLSEYRNSIDDLTCPTGGGVITLSCVEGEIEALGNSSSPATLNITEVEYYFDPSATTTSSDELILPAPVYSGFQIEMFDPDDPLSLMNIESVLLQWDTPGCAEYYGIEMTFDEFDSATTFFPSSDVDEVITKEVWTCLDASSIGDGYDCYAISNVPSQNHNYILRTRPLDCSIPAMNVKFWTGDSATGSQVSVPSRVEVVSIGDGDESQRRISAKTKWSPSASGLVDFVVFSVDQIVK